MREIGVRELKQSLSATLRAVADGEQIRVTMRGKAVADIVPARSSTREDGLRRLVSEGRLTMPSHARPKRAPRLVDSGRSASALVLAERDAER